MNNSGAALQTAVKERPISFSSAMVQAILGGAKTQTRRAIVPAPDRAVGRKKSEIPLHRGEPITCRFGEVGDRLWVRERWSEDPAHAKFFFAADGGNNGGVRWKQSYVMPRRACRIELQITSRRSERLQTISAGDARCEGFHSDALFNDPILWFRELWDGLAKPEQSWSENPWVWVIGFTVI